MEYYYLEPVGILINLQPMDKGEILKILNEGYKDNRDNFLEFLQKHNINRAFTTISPRFKYAFEISNGEIIESSI